MPTEAFEGAVSRIRIAFTWAALMINFIEKVLSKEYDLQN